MQFNQLKTNPGPTSRPALSIEVDGNISPNIATGDLITAVCNAKGGNPTPTLSLFMDNKPIGNPREGQNLHTFLAQPSDNKATLSCAAINSMMRAPLRAEVVLNILCVAAIAVYSYYMIPIVFGI